MAFTITSRFKHRLTVLKRKMWNLFYKRASAPILLAVLDSATLAFLIYLALNLRIYFFPLFFSSLPIFAHTLKKYLWFIAIYLAVLIYEGGYSKRFTFWDEVRMLWKSTIISTIAILFILFATKQSEQYSRLVIITWSSLCILLLPVIRPKIKSILYKTGIGKTKLLIIGAGEDGIRVFKAIRQEHNLGYEVAGFVDDTVNKGDIEGVRVFRFINDIDRYIDASDIDTVAITIHNRSQEEVLNMVNKIHHKVKTIFYVPDIRGIPVTGSELRHFFNEDLFAIEIKNNLENTFNYILKRGFDYTLSLLLLPFVMPIIIIFSILIRLTSEGPAIFSQERIGKNGRIFKCYKFRTMYKDTEERLKEILDNDPQAREEWERTWKLKNDPRITPIGRFLRKTSLDELPQIFNVLKGEMSLIGPRPVVKDELEYHYKDKTRYYCMVPPGITGLWQVSGRSNTTYEERVALDCWYVRNWSPWLDIVILLKTVKVVLKKEGAY